MKKAFTISLFLLITISCGSGKSFQSFFNSHKNDMGTTAFQVPNFMRALLGNISPEINDLFSNLNDFKFITFNEISRTKQTELITEMNLITDNNFTDVLRENTVEKTKIVSVKEDGNVVTQAIVFNSTLVKTTVFYLKGRFDPDRIKELSETNQFENLSSKLLQNYQATPINPN